MRAVSYTRAVSSRAMDENPANSIGIQNEHIEQYAKAHGWKLSTKYSDHRFDKKEITAFEQLIEDGINRRYDMVIADSVFRFGRNVMDAVCILQQTFFPAGIGFAFVNDDFSSLGKSAEEVEEYFRKKRMQIIGETSSARWFARKQNGILSASQQTYGYVLSEDHQHMEVDEEAAHTIRDIFQWFLSGMGNTDIAKRLNGESIMSPEIHMKKISGSRPDFFAGGVWDSTSIRKILTNPIYMGTAKWKGIGNDEVIHVPPIISEEIYNQAQKTMGSKRGVTGTGTTGVANILTRRIYDKETGNPMICTKSPFDENDRVFVVKKASRNLNMSDIRKGISYQLVMEQLRIKLEQEKALAVQVDQFLKRGEAESFLEQKLTDGRVKARVIIDRMNAIYEERMEFHQMYGDGQIKEDAFAQREAECRERLMQCEQEFRAIMAQAEEWKTVYSRVNPWLKLYRDIDVTDDMERTCIRQCIGLVAVIDTRTVEIELKKQEWKAKLPPEWLTLRLEG